MCHVQFVIVRHTAEKKEEHKTVLKIGLFEFHNVHIYARFHSNWYLSVRGWLQVTIFHVISSSSENFLWVRRSTVIIDSTHRRIYAVQRCNYV